VHKNIFFFGDSHVVPDFVLKKDSRILGVVEVEYCKRFNKGKSMKQIFKQMLYVRSSKPFSEYLRHFTSGYSFQHATEGS
jgi:hypothetical protein